MKFNDKARELLRDIDAVLFDLDGTLVDSMWIWKSIDIEYFSKYHIDMPEDLQKHISGMSFTETANYFKEHFPFPESVEEMKATWNAMAEEKYLHDIGLKPGAKEFLDLLKQEGIKCGVASSNSEHLVKLCLKAREVVSYMDSIHTSCEVLHGKPFPDIYLLVASDLGVEPGRCLVFEDILEGVQAGNRAGMHTCGIAEYTAINQWEDICCQAQYTIKDYYDLISREE